MARIHVIFDDFNMNILFWADEHYILQTFEKMATSCPFMMTPFKPYDIRMILQSNGNNVAYRWNDILIGF